MCPGSGWSRAGPRCGGTCGPVPVLVRLEINRTPQHGGGVVSCQISEPNWRVLSRPCHQCQPAGAYGLPGHPWVTWREPQVQGTLIVVQPEHAPPWGDSSSAVPELTPLPPNTASHCPQTVPTAVPSPGHHKSATHLRPAAARGSPWAAVVWGGGHSVGTAAAPVSPAGTGSAHGATTPRSCPWSPPGGGGRGTWRRASPEPKAEAGSRRSRLGRFPTETNQPAPEMAPPGEVVSGQS